MTHHEHQRLMQILESEDRPEIKLLYIRELCKAAHKVGNGNPVTTADTPVIFLITNPDGTERWICAANELAATETAKDLRKTKASYSIYRGRKMKATFTDQPVVVTTVTLEG